jgi:hypothetical protein
MLCQDHNVSWRSFSRPHTSILFSYWSYDLVHQFHPVQDWPIGTEFYPLFPIYTGLPRARSACHLLARCFVELFYDPEDGGDTFLRNVGYHSTHYTASYPRRRYSSEMELFTSLAPRYILLTTKQILFNISHNTYFKGYSGFCKGLWERWIHVTVTLQIIHSDVYILCGLTRRFGSSFHSRLPVNVHASIGLS